MAKEELLEEKAEGTYYEPIIPKIHNWPIAKLYANKQAFMQEVIEKTLAEIYGDSPNAEKLEAEIARTYYSEIQRIKRNPWKADKPDEKDFWNSLKKDTNDFHTDATGSDKLEKYKEIVRIVVTRYVEEITVTFDPKAYHFAKRFLSFGFASLLNAFQAKNLKAIFDHKIFIQDRLKLNGEIDKLRELANRGTIILVPTHFSNLDSIILGWGIHAIGLPAFIYGAGLNLYDSKLIGYFMSRLGAYKVDRRKKNPFYLETLKMFSQVSIEHGVHSLFFPGGTRSRSGAIEEKVKLGLLGTAIDAQRENIVEAKRKGTTPKKIFVVPLVMSYHFVLEAKSLIRQHLKEREREKYYFNRKDEFSSTWTVIKFIVQLLRKRSEIQLSFGPPKDLFGNDVDAEGNSLFNGQQVDIEDYFTSDGEITIDVQREHVYTKNLGDRISEYFLQTNIVLSSHLVAFLAYELIKLKNNSSTVYDLYELEDKELVIERDSIKQQIEQSQQYLFQLEKEGKLKLSNEIKMSAEELLKDGVKNVGVFHNNKPLVFTRNGDVQTQDIELLYYYHNRMKGYELEKTL